MRRRSVAVAAAPIVIVCLVLASGLVPSAARDAAAIGTPEAGASLVPSPSVTFGPLSSADPSPTPLASPSLPADEPAAGPGTAEVLAPRLQHALDHLRGSLAIPGVSATLIFPDGSTWTGTGGFANLRTRTRVQPTTAFALASISKTFLAALTLDLVAEGRLRLEDRAADRLPGLHLDPRITVRQLLDHTSGLADFFLNPKIEAALRTHASTVWTAEQALSYVGTPYFPPGREWKYSNTNYLLLGLIAERVGGAPLGVQMRKRYFGPLGLTTAFTQVSEEPRGPIAHGYRFPGTAKSLKPIDLADGSGIMPFTSVVTAAGGAGSVAAGSADVARWARALYGGQILDPSSLRLMLDDVARTARFHPRVPYGLGVEVHTVDGRKLLGHAGRFLGFASLMGYLPDSQIAIAVETNQSRADPKVIVRDLLRVVLGMPAPPASPAPSAAP